MTSHSRRDVLRFAVAGAGALIAAQTRADTDPWAGIAEQYDVDRTITNLENAYWGVMARPVAAAYLERTRFLNRVNVAYVRDAVAGQVYSKDLEAVRARLATTFGCAAGEVALTRSGTEALQNLIVNYNRLKPGDAVLYADLDFDAAQFAMDFLQDRRGARVVRFTIPEPATRANILETYERVLAAARRPRLLLLTHMSHRTGLVLPVAEIAAMARRRGVDVILDAAQSAGHLDFRIGDLGVDFAAFSLHKFVGAPLGTACLYVKSDRVGDVDPHLANRDWPADDIRARVLTGTTNFAGVLTIPDALRYQDQVGVARKEARLRHLRDYWVARARELPRIEILTPDDPSLHAGITSFRVRDVPAALVQKTLISSHLILTAARKGITNGDAVRVTPALYTTEPELDRLVSALRIL